MPHTLRILFLLRRVLFTAVAVLMTLTVWLLLADILMRHPLGAFTLKHFSIQHGFWPILDHGFRGAMAVYPETLAAHWAITLLGLGIFCLTQFLFLNPTIGWLDSLIHRTPLPSSSIILGAFPMALLSVGAMSIALEAVDLWQWLPGPTFRAYGCLWLSPTLLLWFSLLVSWAAWSVWLQRRLRHGDHYMHMASMIYALFVVAGLEIFAGGLIHLKQVGLTSSYWHSGTYTGLILASSVLLWTLGPGLILIYAAGQYCTRRRELIHAGDAMGKQWFAPI